MPKDLDRLQPPAPASTEDDRWQDLRRQRAPTTPTRVDRDSPRTEAPEAKGNAAEPPWTDELARALRDRLYDESLTVRLAANQALDRLWHTREIDRLVAEILEETDFTRRWCLLDIVLEGGYPGLTGAHLQPWIVQLFKHLPLAMRQYANDRLEEKRQELANGLQRRKRSE